jgi:hypothetical protein
MLGMVAVFAVLQLELIVANDTTRATDHRPLR